VTVHLDTSALVDALTGPRRSLDVLVGLVDEGHRVALSTLVLYEWLRGPRTWAELSAQEEIFPRESALPFDVDAAASAAALYGEVNRPRGREVDLSVAACALSRDAALWTLNTQDFHDLPGLELV